MKLDSHNLPDADSLYSQFLLDIIIELIKTNGREGKRSVGLHKRSLPEDVRLVLVQKGYKVEKEPNPAQFAGMATWIS